MSSGGGCYGSGAARGGVGVMLEELEVLGAVTETGFKFADNERVRQALRGFKRGQVLVKFATYRDTRSLQANRYYWGVVLALIAEHTGSSAEDIHDAMCEMFLPSEQRRVEFFSRVTGEVIKVTTDRRRSSKLTSQPFYDFVERVRQWASEFLGVETPEPDPAYWRKKEAA